MISIEQKDNQVESPIDEVGTITEVYDLFRLLCARAVDAYSHASGKKWFCYTRGTNAGAHPKAICK